MMAKSDNGELNRSVVASNTSDPNNSLLKKVTKRVSGLFPSSLTKWFGPSEGHQSVVRRRESVDEDDDEDDTLQVLQPPKKRAKPSSDTDFASTSSFTITSTPMLNSRNDLRHLQPGPSGYTRQQTVTSVQYEGTSTRTDTAILNGDDKSDSGDSTSGYSSVLVQQHKETSFTSDRGNISNQPSTSKTSPNKSLNASLNSTRSLFSDQSLNPQRSCLSARRPTFSASTFGSPSFVDRTLSTKRAVNSPFYGGRTMYGGASAYRRNRIIFPRDEANNVSIKNSIDMKPANEAPGNANDSVNLSKTARRILDALEHFSTPVVDAKKIPSINSKISDAKIQRKTPYAREGNRAPNKELLVPTVPDLLKMKLKERLQDSTVQVRKVATTSKSILNTEYSIPTVEQSTKPQKHVNKMKTKIATTREKKDNMNDTVDAVKLPEIALPITSLPKFDFTLPPPPTVNKSPEKTAPKLTPPVSSVSKSIESTTSTSATNQFKFSEPIVVSGTPKSVTSINNFKFSEPLNAKDNNQSTSVASSLPASFTFKASNSSTAPRKKESTKNNGQNNDMGGFGLKPTEQFATGSVMDILGKPEKKQSDNLMDKFKPASGTWECAACMVRNIPTNTRCVACETLREAPKKVEEQSSGFGNKFKMSSDKWECGACMVRNNMSDTKCVACTTPKPGAAPAPASTAPAPTPIAGGFGDKFKPASGTWECSACMVRNKTEAAKCVACETPKPGAKTDNKPTLIMPVETKSSGSGFGELIKKQQSSWECSSCMVRNPPEKKICLCCEAPKPGEQPQISFGAKATGGTQFKFGIDKTETSSPSSGFKFGIDNSAASTAAAPATFSFGVKPTETKTSTTSSTGFTFGMPPVSKPEAKASEASPAKPTVAFTPVVTAPSTPATSLPFSMATTTASEPGKSTTFSFGSPAATTSSNIFGSSTFTPAKPSFSFGGNPATPVATTAAVTAASAAPTFTASSGNLFGNASTTVVSTTSAATMSFGAPAKPVMATTPATISTPAPSTFSLGAASTPKPTPFGSEGNLPVPQFNFGAGGLPFNPVYPSSKPTTATTSAPSINFTGNNGLNSQQNTSVFGAANNQQTFSFNAGSGTSNNNNKNETKPFSFGGNGEPAAKVPAFSFAPKDNQTPAPLAKAPVFNFGSSASLPQAEGTGFSGGASFNFAAKKPDNPPPYGATNTSAPSMFGAPAQAPNTPQNGGFNFGAANPTPNFNFGASASATPSPGVFGFGANQAGSGSSAAASPAGVFSFGAVAPASQQQPSAFTPDIKPNFNFTGGSVPNFTAQGAPSAAMPQRKIRKAVRRTQPR